MPIPSTVNDLSPTAALNSPAGSDSPTDGDNFLRALSAIIRQEHDAFAGSASGTAAQGAGAIFYNTAATYATATVGYWLSGLGDTTRGDALIGVDTTGTARTQHQWNGGQFKNLVSDFGAVGDDSTDNASVIETAMAWMAANGGGTLHVPPGTYRHSTPIKYRDGVRFIGSSKYDTIFRKTGTGTLSVTGGDSDLDCLGTTSATAKMTDGSGNVNCCLWIHASVRAIGGEIANMTFRGNGSNATASNTRLGVAGIGVSEYSIHDIHVEFVSLAAFVFPVCFASNLYNLHSINCGKGLCIENGTSITASSNYFNESQWAGYHIRDVSYSSFIGCAVDSLNNETDSTDYTDRSVNSIAYIFDACRSIKFQGGAEQCFGTQLKIDSCIDMDADITILGPASDYSGAEEVALVYIDELAHGVKLKVLAERGGVTAIQGDSVGSEAAHHDLYVDVVSENQGFKILSWKTCNNKYDAPSAIYGNNVPSYLQLLKQDSQIQGAFTPTLVLPSPATSVSITYGSDNGGVFWSLGGGRIGVEGTLHVTNATFSGTASSIFPEVGGFPFDVAGTVPARIFIDYSSVAGGDSFTFPTTGGYWIDLEPATTQGTIQDRATAAVNCGTAFSSGGKFKLHFSGVINVGNTLSVV